jgi:AcrR family transcriptional regulator
LEGGGGLRRARKAATRERVLAAARELFTATGYEAATVRQIAERAGVAVGSVFTTFASKGEILTEVMKQRLDGLYAELDEQVPRLAGSTAERLTTLFRLLLAFEAGQAKLFLAHIAAAFDWTLPEGAHPFGRNPRLRALVADCLADGLARGDVDPATDLEATVELLVGAFAWTFRLAAWENAGPEAMTAAMDRQIGLIAAGFRPR